VLRVTVVRLPRISNFTDVDALAAEPGVAVGFVARAAGWPTPTWSCCPAPGPRWPTWLAARAPASPTRCSARPRPGARCSASAAATRCWPGIEDEVESGAGGRSPGSGCCRGLVEVLGGDPFVTDLPDPTDPRARPLDGCALGPVLGTLWHGVLESDGFRAALLDWVAAHGSAGSMPGSGPRPRSAARFAAAREAQFDRLADAVDAHLDTAALLRLIQDGPTPGLPALPPGSLR
jgi:adenosylcobyric acid synthase